MLPSLRPAREHLENRVFKELELIGTSIWKLPSANDVWKDRLKEQFVRNIPQCVARDLNRRDLLMTSAAVEQHLQY